MVVGMVGVDDTRQTLMSRSVKWLIVVVGSMVTGGGLPEATFSATQVSVCKLSSQW
jgi:hypothetical protein